MWRVVYLVENLHRFVELYIPQEGSQVLEQVNQQLRIHGPTLEDKNTVMSYPSVGKIIFTKFWMCDIVCKCLKSLPSAVVCVPAFSQ